MRNKKSLKVWQLALQQELSDMDITWNKYFNNNQVFLDALEKWVNKQYNNDET